MTLTRAVRWAIAGALVIGIATLLWSWKSPLQAGHGGVGGYPERIAKPHIERKLPARPGPLAAIVEDNNFGNAIHYGVDEWGYAWRLPSSIGTPVLNPSGTQLLSITGDVDPRLTLRDLNSGEVRRFDDVGSDSRGPQDGRRAPYRLNQSDGVWSPDGLSIAMTTTHRGSRRVPIVIDLQSGQVEELGVKGTVAGWLSDGQLVILKARSVEHVVVDVTAVSVGLGEEALESIPLRPAEPWTGNEVVGRVSPGGALVVCDEGLNFFDLTSGDQVASRRGPNGLCPQTWRGGDPVVGTKVYGTPARSVLVTEDVQRSLVAVDPRFQSNSVSWAADAINGQVHHGLWGTNSARWTWYWREALLLLLVASLVAVVGSGLITRRRRNKQSGGFDVPGTSNPPD